MILHQEPPHPNLPCATPTTSLPKSWIRAPRTLAQEHRPCCSCLEACSSSAGSSRSSAGWDRNSSYPSLPRVGTAPRAVLRLPRVGLALRANLAASRELRSRVGARLLLALLTKQGRDEATSLPSVRNLYSELCNLSCPAPPFIKVL